MNVQNYILKACIYARESRGNKQTLINQWNRVYGFLPRNKKFIAGNLGHILENTWIQNDYARLNKAELLAIASKMDQESG